MILNLFKFSLFLFGIIDLICNKNPDIILGCGIFGIINKDEVPFDYSTFCVLGINNDSRGGDSCGVFIDQEVEYGVDKEKLFKNFIYKSVLVQSTETCKIALGHCRKASVGRISAETAQPVCICNDKGQIEFVVIHNGTIHNYEELAKKYIPEINIKGMTDSQVMAQIFYHKGYDVLGEYKGGAVFVIVDYRKGEPRTYFWKGWSPKNQWQKDFIEERPLFISRYKDELVFSSIRDYLEVLRPDNVLQTIAANVLVGYKEGKLYRLQEFDRSKCYQEKPVVYSSYYNRDWDNYDGTVFSNPCRSTTTDPNKGLYLIDKKLLDGKFWMSRYGSIWMNKPEHCLTATEMYFFNGIAIPKEESYNLIVKMYKKFGLDDPELFIECFENIIRFLSYDQIYTCENKKVKATSATTYEEYTGEYQMIGQSQIRHYKDGVETECVLCKGNYPDFKVPNVDVKVIKKIWRPLMR